MLVLVRWFVAECWNAAVTGIVSQPSLQEVPKPLVWLEVPTCSYCAGRFVQRAAFVTSATRYATQPFAVQENEWCSHKFSVAAWICLSHSHSWLSNRRYDLALFAPAS